MKAYLELWKGVAVDLDRVIAVHPFEINWVTSTGAPVGGCFHFQEDVAPPLLKSQVWVAGEGINLIYSTSIDPEELLATMRSIRDHGDQW